MKIRNIDFGEFPIFLAPMEYVTDIAFRLVCKEFGADLVYTEFVSADALRDSRFFIDKDEIISYLTSVQGKESIEKCLNDYLLEKAIFIDIDWGCHIA